MMIVAMIGLIVLVAMLRMIPGTLWPASASDAGYHMLLRREIRRNHMRMPQRVAIMALDERQTYPWLYHWLLASVPERWIERMPALPSTLIDSLHTAMAFVLAAWLAPRIDPSIDPVASGLMAGLLFATMPALLAIGIGPRAYEITPRPFGELLYSLSLLAGGSYIIDGMLWSGLVAVLAIGMLLMSSKFAAQVILLCVPPLALCTGQWEIIAILPFGLIAALLLSGGRYWWILNGQIAHLRLYRERMQYDHPALAMRNQFGKTFTTLRSLIRSRFRDGKLLRDLLLLLENNTYAQMLIRNILWIGVLVASATGLFAAWGGSAEQWSRWLIVWSLTPLLPFLISSLPHWRFLGEAERYLEYSVFPICVLGAIGILRLPTATATGLLMVYTVINLPILIYFWLRRRWISKHAQKKALDELLTFLATIPSGVHILTLPITLASTIAYQFEHFFLAVADTSMLWRNYDRIFTRYPWPSTDIDWWQQVHHVEYLVVMPDLLARLPNAATYELDGLQPAFVNEEYTVYDIRARMQIPEGCADEQHVNLSVNR